jgi:hypothetical protein
MSRRANGRPTAVCGTICSFGDRWSMPWDEILRLMFGFLLLSTVRDGAYGVEVAGPAFGGET